ncbi:helix-turn-helix domain-containing protein [Nocardia lasii]|uniref:Helix-turn-helix domain-containing protein n=1 Tax=Nocardia lasii TaxID=1616107 RepID=A0ABW1JXL0_9NOCA
MENPRAPIARYLRERREAAGMTRAALSESAGISPGLIQKIEQGTRMPTLEALTALFTALAVPEMIRDHLVSLSLADRYDPAPPTLVRRTDQALVDGISHPASLQLHPTFHIAADNAAWRRLFPGLEVGDSMLAWMLLDPRAKTVLVDWEQQTHLCAYAFRVMGPGLETQARIAELVELCSRAPEWERLWTTEPESTYELDDPVVRCRDPRTGEVTTMSIHSLGASLMPRRDWSLVVYSPRPERPRKAPRRPQTDG